MFTPAPFSLATHTQHLSYWVVIRTLVLLCLCSATLGCLWQGAIKLHYQPILITLSLMAALNWLTFIRLKQPLAVSSLEFLIQLVLDILALSVLFYFSGGANNPFISYFLVPICVAAATLSERATLLITAIAAVSYSLLLFFNTPLPVLSPHAEHMHKALSPHILGMWLNFFISAGLITFFVVRMARDLRAQEAIITRKREDELRDEQLMAVATLAAGTAHELGTPLSTMKLLLGELRDEHQEQANLQADLILLTQQVEQCASILRKLVNKAEQTKDGLIAEKTLLDYCNALLEGWQILRPEVNAKIQFDAQSPSTLCHFHPTIAQALINLLNNAADANPNHLGIEISWNSNELTWIITDQGLGIPEEINPYLGKKIIENRPQGLGIGLFLTQATITRYGGQVEYSNGVPKGTITRVSLPLRCN